MENNGATPILIETATVPGTEAGEVRNADNRGLSKNNLLSENLICNFLVNCWSQEAVLLRTWSTN